MQNKLSSESRPRIENATRSPAHRPRLRRLPLSKIQLHPNHSPAIAKAQRLRMADAITRLDYVAPLLVRPLNRQPLSAEDADEATYELLDGHHRLDHLRARGVRRFDCLVLEVDDAEGRLLGVLQASAVRERLAENVGEDYGKAAGIIGGEELRSMPLRIRCSRRLAWLSLNIVLNIAAASVIAMHQDTLEAVIALAVFLPIISDMSGCSGNQAVAVSMRELSINVTRPRDFLYVWGKEAMVGLINGALLGLLLGTIAWLWQGNATLGAVVGLALALNTLVAVSIGGTVPLVLRGLKLDPALASGPILTTVTDMCGFFLVLTMASWTLARLTA